MIVFILFILWCVFLIWSMLIFVDRDVDPSVRTLVVMFCPIIHVWFCIKFTKWENLKNLFDEDYLFED